MWLIGLFYIGSGKPPDKMLFEAEAQMANRLMKGAPHC